MPDLTSFEELVSVGASRTVKLSPGSLAVLFSALELIGGSYQWIGTAEDGSLTVAERDRVDDYIDMATYELMRVAGMREIGDTFSRFIAVPPDGALPMDGMPRLKADYPALMDFIPDSWKSENDFVLPNMATRVLVGAPFTYNGSEFAVGQTGGELYHQLTEAEMPQHNHSRNTSNVPEYVIRYTSGGTYGIAPGSAPILQNQTNTGNRGNNAPHNNMPPMLGVYWFIQAE